MARYDWGRGYGPDRGYGSMGGGYASDYAGWGSTPGSGFRGGGGGGGNYPRWSYGGRGYDRGIYGGDYPAYGGYPGGAQRGMYYGGGGGTGAGLDEWGMRQRSRGGGRGYDWGGGYGGLPGGSRGGFGGYAGDREPGFRASRGYGSDFRGGYGGAYGTGRYGGDTGYARAPFVPEEAYRMHPELERGREHARGRWPDGGTGQGAGGMELDDDEVVQAVRQSLHQDSWIQPDHVEVSVEGGVVTLTGEVDDYMQARYAWDDAWETAGVRGVINNLTVRTDEPNEPHGEVVPQTSGKKK